MATNATDAMFQMMESFTKQFAAVIDDMRKETPLDVAKGFAKAVDWSEPWLIALLVAEFAILAAVIATRKRPNFQIFSFLSILLLVYNAEPINSYCSQHWKSFATQPYFDQRGLFISVVFSGPLLLISSIQIMLCLATSAGLLVKVKRAAMQKKNSSKKTQ
mmetsp:Transcript_34315/g.55496  ORF Transcript_34315/g.55496 Transcript_34315/m.55496 type:complete len:161 (+) Transcript_34315:57-539(+)